jgi:hypothetical protein
MIKKKAKKKAGAKKKAAVETSKTKGKKLDLAEVRKNIAEMVMEASPKITKALIQDAKKGHLTNAKYLNEMAGIHPRASEDSDMKAEDDSLAKTLLDRMNIPFGVVPVREGEIVKAMEQEKPPAETASAAEVEKSGEAAQASDVALADGGV